MTHYGFTTVLKNVRIASKSESVYAFSMSACRHVLPTLNVTSLLGSARNTGGNEVKS